MADLKDWVAIVVVDDRDFAEGLVTGLSEAGAIGVVVDPVQFGRLEFQQTLFGEHKNVMLFVGNNPQFVQTATHVVNPNGLIVRLCADEPVASNNIDPSQLPQHCATTLDLSCATNAAKFTGRCIAALAMDPDVREKHAGFYTVSELVDEYRFSDPQHPIGAHCA